MSILRADRVDGFMSFAHQLAVFYAMERASGETLYFRDCRTGELRPLEELFDADPFYNQTESGDSQSPDWNGCDWSKEVIGLEDDPKLPVSGWARVRWFWESLFRRKPNSTLN